MALLTDSDDLNQATEVVFDTTGKTIQLLKAGNLSDDGVTIKTVYSFSKEEWKNDSNLIKFPFPFVPITDEFFELVEGWTWEDATTVELLRRAGYLVRNTSGNVIEHWAGLAILSAESDDQCYYQLDGDTAPSDFVYTGNTAEVVQVIDDPNGDGNYVDGFDKSADITVFNREQGQLFSSASASGNGEASLLAPKLFSFGLPTGSDLNVLESDVNIEANTPYTGMTITYHTTAQTFNTWDFGVVIDGNSGTLEEIYEFLQHELRESTDIDDGLAGIIGQLADVLAEFTGGTGDGSGTLKTLQVTNPEGGGTGVYIDNFLSADTNRLSFTDNTGTVRQYPFVAGLTIEFSPTLVSDSGGEYFVFFTDANGNNFGDTDAILVDDNSDVDMTGAIVGSSEFHDFDYDGNVQGGRTSGTDADITVVAIGLETAQYVVATGTIARSTTNTVSLVAALERQYENA